MCHEFAIPSPSLHFLPSSLSQSSETVLEAVVARADKPVGKQVFSCPAGGCAAWHAFLAAKRQLFFNNINQFLSIKIYIDSIINLLKLLGYQSHPNLQKLHMHLVYSRVSLSSPTLLWMTVLAPCSWHDIQMTTG